MFHEISSKFDKYADGRASFGFIEGFGTEGLTGDFDIKWVRWSPMSRLQSSIDSLSSEDKMKYLDWYLSVTANDFVNLSHSGKVKFVVGGYLALINWSKDAEEESS